jgi:hypothetical protein
LDRGAFWVEEIEGQPGGIGEAEGEAEGAEGTGGIGLGIGGELEGVGWVEGSGGETEAIGEEGRELGFEAGGAGDDDLGDGGIGFGAGEGVEGAEGFAGGVLDEGEGIRACGGRGGIGGIGIPGGFLGEIGGPGEEEGVAGEDFDGDFVWAEGDEGEGFIGIGDVAGLDAASVGVREEAEGGEFESGFFGELLVELDGFAFDDGDEDFEAGEGGFGGGGFLGGGRGGRALREGDGAADLEVDDGVFWAEGEVATGLEVDEGSEFAGVLGWWEEEGPEDDEGARDAHDDGGRLDAETVEGGAEGLTDDERVGGGGLRGEFELGGGEAGDGWAGRARDGLTDAEGEAIEIDGGDGGGCAGAFLPFEGEMQAGTQ